MSLLQVIEDAPGYLKATLQGPQGSGKTRTATELACFTHKYFGSKKPIAFFDTETGSDYVAHLIEERTGMKPIRLKTRAFSDLITATNECVGGAADVLIADSISHVWRELGDAYMKRINEGRSYQKTRMDIQDIMQVKSLWAPWPDLFLNSPVHIIVCGREGNEWGNQENEETGKLELVQTGKKMKVEAEFGYEASLMIAMSARQVQGGLVKKKNKKVEHRNREIVNVATVLKDRFDVLNGQAFEYPKGEDFLPFIERLKPASHQQVDTRVKSDGDMKETDQSGWSKEKRDRVILCEEIQGEMTRVYPGQTAKEKAAKLALLDRAFNSRSWTRVETLGVGELKQGYQRIVEILKDPAAFEESLAAAAASAA